MPGSRKGERRGGAKPRIVRKPATKRGFGTGAGIAKGQKNRVKTPDEVMRAKVGAILERHIPVAAKEKKIEDYFLVTGRRMRLPKEVMLDAMRYFEEAAIDWGEVVRGNMIQSATAETPEARQIFESAVAGAEQRMVEMLTMAVDVAYKAAPYVHPRLAAMITNPGAEQNPLNAVAALFKELDEAGRPHHYIDHDPAEVAKNG